MLDKKERNRNIYIPMAQNSNLYFSEFRNDDKSNASNIHIFFIILIDICIVLWISLNYFDEIFELK